MIDKRAIRAAARQARAAFVTDGPVRIDPLFLARLAPDLVVVTYLPVGAEADPAPLANAARAAGCRLALPVTRDLAEPILFVAWHDDTPLTDGPYGLRQPAASDRVVRPDIILTPLVAFDRLGNRVGQGAGHYDRAFVAYPDSWRVGIAWSLQEVAAIPADLWDVPLHVIATEKEWIVP